MHDLKVVTSDTITTAVKRLDKVDYRYAIKWNGLEILSKPYKESSDAKRGIKSVHKHAGTRTKVEGTNVVVVSANHQPVFNNSFEDVETTLAFVKDLKQFSECALEI